MAFQSDLSRLTEQYMTALRSFIQSGEERWLEQAYEIGREAIAAGLGVLDVVSIHHAVLASLTSETPAGVAPEGITKASATFVSESLSPFEMTHRSYKEANDSLLRLNQQLEQRVRERTQELEHVNRELNDFAQVVSHDLKAPLIGIEAIVQLILMGNQDALDEEGRELLDVLMKRTSHMQTLIDGILQYSRAGQAGGEKVHVNLNRLLQEIVEMIAPPPQVQIVIENEMPRLVCDKFRIHQVFQNLLSNAVKFIDDQEGEIRISCVDDGEFWRFSVADNGIGIDEDQCSRIFQLFVVLNPSAAGDSSGIGLSVVARIVEGNGGKVWVKSRKGAGSTFWFTWPKSETQEQ